MGLLTHECIRLRHKINRFPNQVLVHILEEQHVNSRVIATCNDRYPATCIVLKRETYQLHQAQQQDCKTEG